MVVKLIHNISGEVRSVLKYFGHWVDQHAIYNQLARGHDGVKKFMISLKTLYVIIAQI